MLSNLLHQARFWLRLYLIFGLSLVGVKLLLTNSIPVARASNPITAGYRDFNFGPTANSTPTGEKPESKLWWNDGLWWGSLWSPAAGAYHIYKLNMATQDWVDTGTALDNRSSSKADTLWDGQHLYVVSHQWSGTGSISSAPVRLYRYSYDPGTKTYSPDGVFRSLWPGPI